jgi:hypothetical protein
MSSALNPKKHILFFSLEYVHQPAGEDTEEEGEQGCDEDYEGEKGTKFDLFCFAFLEVHGNDDAEVIVNANYGGDDPDDRDPDKAFPDGCDEDIVFGEESCRDRDTGQ